MALLLQTRVCGACTQSNTPPAVKLAGMADDDPRTGGMIALVPTAEDAERLAVQGGDDPDALHLTLVYLGDDVTGWDDDAVDKLTADLDAHTTELGGPLSARVMGHAQFNPDGGPDGEQDPCAVYLVGDTNDVGPLRDSVLELLARHELPVAEQHTPFIPHVTGGYGIDTSVLAEAGPVTFDRLRLALGDQEIDVPLGEGLVELGEDYEPPEPVPVDEVEAKSMPAKRRNKLDEQGHTLRKGDGQYPIGNLNDLNNAITAWGRAKPGDRPALKRHLLAEARRLNAPAKTVDRIKALEAKSGEPVGIEVKVASPDPRAARLRAYWAHGKGLAKWFRGLGTPGNFRRLRAHLAKYVHGERILNGLTANIYHEATGQWPGKRGHKSLAPVMEFKSLFDDNPEIVEDDTEREMCAGIDEWGGEFLDRADDIADPDGDDDADGQDGEHADEVPAGLEGKAAPPVGMVTIPASDLPMLFPDEDDDSDTDVIYPDLGDLAATDPDGIDRLMLDTDAAILAADQLVTADGEDEDEDWTEVATRDKRYVISGDAVLEEADDDLRHAPPAAMR